MPDKCLDCPVPSADMDGFIVSGPGGAPRSDSAGVSGSEGPFVKEAPQTGHFILKGKVSSSSPLPDVPEPGWAYEAAEAGTYGGAQATAGDVVWCAGVNPVRWAILQSDSGSVVSVRQILSSGTKIATVTVGGQATDLYCETGGGIQTLSGNFGCETQEISPAVDGPAVLYATQMVFLDQIGFETLEDGNFPYGRYSSAYSGSHQSASFSTSVPSSAPYAIALSTGVDQYASGYLLNSMFIGDWPYGGAVKVSDLLAAGETGVKLDFSSSIGSAPYGDGTLDVYASFSANQDGSYTVSYSARKDAVTEDVLTAKIDGKDGAGAVVSSVDVSPLLNYIGGRVEEVSSGDSEMLPLVDQDNPGVEPPFYFCDELNFSNSGDVIYPDGGAFSDGVLTVSFSASSPEPESFVPFFYYGDPSSRPSLLYVKLDSSTGMPAAFALETALAGPIVLDEFGVSAGQPVPTGSTVSLITERVEGDAPAYSFTLYSGSVELKKVLRLYPSCDGDIDLSGLVPAPSPSGGVEDYELAFEQTAATGATSILADLSSYKAGADGFLDVLAVLTFYGGSLQVISSVSTSSQTQPLYALVEHPDPSSEAMGLGFARFWNDGGALRISCGSGYNGNSAVLTQTHESYSFDSGGALRSSIPCFSVVGVTSTVQGGDIGGTTLKVYVRRACASGLPVGPGPNPNPAH